MCVTVASVVSPALSGAAIGAGLGIFLLGFFVACCAAAAFGARWLHRALRPSQDNAPQSRSPVADEAAGAKADKT
jgi:hypothetical protein